MVATGGGMAWTLLFSQRIQPHDDHPVSQVSFEPESDMLVADQQVRAQAIETIPVDAVDVVDQFRVAEPAVDANNFSNEGFADREETSAEQEIDIELRKPPVPVEETSPPLVPVVVVSNVETAGDNTYDGLGISQLDITQAIEEFFDADFEFRPIDAESEAVSTTLEDIEVTLWGDVGNLDAITVSVRFDGELPNWLLAGIVQRALPSWNTSDAGSWFSKAATRCDLETMVSTYRDGVELAMTAENDDSYVVFFQPDRG